MTEATLVPPRRHTRPHSQTPVPRADPDAADRYLSAVQDALCRDAAGYGRSRHDYVVWTRSGTRCLFCGRLELELW